MAASPFKVFRKNAKVLLVGLFLLSMISFVVIPSFLQWLETQRGRRAGLVATTKKFGNLTEVQLRSLHAERVTVRRFLEALLQRVSQAGGNPFRIQLALALIEQPTEESLVHSWLVAQYAHAAGMQVSDKAVNAFIRSLIDASGVSLSQSDLISLMRSRNIDENTLFAGLAHEILVFRYSQLAGIDLLSLQPGLTGETPGARWDYFLRFNRMAQIELCELPLTRYIDKVADPDERTVRAFFEEHKTRLPNPFSPEPGFKVPAKVSLEYLKGDFQKWLVNIKITDEELRKIYEERKDQLFVRSSPPAEQQVPPGSTPPLSAPEMPPPATEQPQQEAPGLPPAEQPQGSPEVKPEAGIAPEGMTPPEVPPAEQPAGPSPAESTPPMPESSGDARNEGQAPAEPSGPEEKASENPAPSGMGNSEARSWRVVLTSLVEDDAQKPEESPATEEQPDGMMTAPGGGEAANEAQPVAPPAEQGAPESGQPAPSEKAEAQGGMTAEGQPAEQPAGQEAVPQPQSSEPPKTPEPSPAVTEAPAETPPTPPSKYRPFEEVKDQLRTIIVQERMRQALDEIEEIMRQYQGDRASYESEREAAESAGKTPPSPPARPDLKKLAQERNLDYLVVEMAPIWDIARLDIGQAMDFQGAPFSRSVFEVAEFLALRAIDLDQNQYLAWVTEKVREHVPTLDDPGVRENVVRTWKMQEARKLAAAEAQSLVTKINENRQTLTDFFAGLKTSDPSGNWPDVVESEPFSWLTYGELDLARLTRGQPRLSPIKARVKDPASGLIVEKDAVQDVGNEFMATVFSLEPGEAALAWNQPQTILYIVRVVEFQPPVDQLFERFVREGGGETIQASQFDLAEMYRRWLRMIEEEAGLRMVHADSRTVSWD